MNAPLAAAAVVTVAASGVTTATHVASVVATIAGAVLSVVAVLGAWRWVIKPVRAAWREAVALLRQIRDASRGVERLSLELHELSGAVVQMTVHVLEAQQRQQLLIDDTRDRLSHATEMVIDLAADFRRLERAHRAKGHQ